MGRCSTGAMTTNTIQRIELSLLLKNGQIQKGRHISTGLTWSNDSSIGLKTAYTEDEAYIELNYTNTSCYNDEVTKHNYRIYLTTLPSNLGRGEVLYFECPQTHRRCRILYKCYGSLTWKSRFAYSHRIYYRSQIGGKYDYHHNRYWAILSELEKLWVRQVKEHYKGNKTKIQQRIKVLEHKLKYHDYMRCITIPKAFMGILDKFDF